MKNKKYLTIILSIILTTTLLFIGCGKKEKTVTAITSEQFTTLYENTKTIYTETPELFAEDAEKPNLDLDSVTDSEIPMSEAMILKDAIQTLVNDNFSHELSKVTDDMLQNPEKGMDEEFYKAYVVAKQHNLLPSGVTDSNWDEAITKAEAIDLILKSYEAIAKRDGYATNQQDGLNEGSVVGRGDSTSVDSETTNTADVEIDGEILEDTGITEEEFEEFKATATGALKNNIDRYEKIKANGSYTDSDGTVWDKVVGTPGDTSWRKMTDEQAQQILATADPSSDEYYAAESELEGANWSTIDAETGTVYFDFYEYLKVAQAEVQERLNSAEQKIIDNAIMDREQNPEEWDEMMGGDIKN